MPKLKPEHIFVSDEEDAVITKAALSDPDNPPWPDDDAPAMRPAREVLPPALYAALTDKSTPATITLVSDEEDRARQKRMGRPPSANPKQATTIRLDADIMGALRKLGTDWQIRVNAILREAVEQGRI